MAKNINNSTRRNSPQLADGIVGEEDVEEAETASGNIIQQKYDNPITWQQNRTIITDFS